MATITISSLTLSDCQISNLGNNKTGTASVTNNSASVTLNTALPAHYVGKGGYQISLNSVIYEVLSTESTTALTLNTVYAGLTNASVNYILYPAVELRIYVLNSSFTPAGTSLRVQMGAVGSSAFYKRVCCSFRQISGVNSLVIPALTLYSTADIATPAESGARYSAWFHRLDGSRVNVYEGFGDFALAATPTSATWAQIALYNRPSIHGLSNNSSYNTDQINALVSQNANISGTTDYLLKRTSNGADASALRQSGNTVIAADDVQVTGDLTASTAAAAMYDNGGAVYDARNAASVSALVTTLGANNATIQIGNTQTISGTVTVPKNVKVSAVGAGLITVPTGARLDLHGGFESDGKKRFNLTGATVADAQITIGSVAITNATNASPIVITATGHGYSTGDQIMVYGVEGNTAANNLPDPEAPVANPRLWTITVINANSFSLDSSTGNGAYTSGGLATKAYILNSATANFQASDTFSPIQISGAGASGAAWQGTIAYRVSATRVILSHVATTAVSGATLTYRYGKVTFGGVDMTSGGTADSSDHPASGAIIPTLNPKWWGVVGDLGSNGAGTDDTLAIQQMISVTPAYSKTVWDGNLRCKVTGTLTFADRVGFKWEGQAMVGSGQTGSVPSIQFVGPIGGRLFNFASVFDFEISGMYWSGNGNSATASTTNGADNVIWLNQVMSFGGTLTSNGIFRNMFMYGRNLRPTMVVVYIGDKTGNNGEYFKFIDVDNRPSAEDNPAAVGGIPGTAYFLAHDNVKQSYILRGTIKQAKYCVTVRGGSFVMDGTNLGYSMTGFNLLSWTDKLVIANIDSEGLAQFLTVPVGAGTNGPIEIRGGRYDRDNTAGYSGLVGTLARPWINLNGQVRLTAVDNSFGTWAHSSDKTWYDTNRYLFTDAGSSSIVWHNNLITNYDETQLALNLQTAHTVNFWSRDRGFVVYSGDSVNSSGINGITTTALPRELIANLHLAGEINQPGTANNVTVDNGKWEIGGLADPLLPTLHTVGTAGSTEYNLLVIGVDASGRRTMPSGVSRITTANATLTGSNYIQVDWAAIPGVSTYILVQKDNGSATYRTVATGIATNTYNVVTNPVGAFSYTLPTFNETSAHILRGSITQAQFGSGQVNSFAAPTTFSSTVSLNGVTLYAGTPQTLTGPGAVNLTTYATLLVTTGADALTLAAGSEGQYKFIRMKTDGGDGTLTVTNLQGGTTITFNDAGDFVLLFYLDAKWHILTNSGCTVA